MEYEYKGTVYEFPDDMNDNQALKLIRADQGEDTTTISEPIQKPVEEKKGPLPVSYGITGTYSAPPVDVGPTYKERVQTDLEEEARKGAQREAEGGAKWLSNIRGGVQYRASQVRQAPGMYEAGQAIGGITQKLLPGTMSAIGSTIKKLEEKAPPDIRSLSGIATGALEIAPTVYGGVKGISAVSKGVKTGKYIDDIIKEGIEKGVKPGRKTKQKGSYKKITNFQDDGVDAVKTIAEYKDFIDLVDDVGNAIEKPSNMIEFAQAIDKTKQAIFKQYNEMAIASGEAGARFNVNPIISKLEKMADPKGKFRANKAARSHINDVIEDLKGLDGATPDIVQETIREFNESLAGYYDGRIKKSKARIDGSVAKLLREQMDDQIESSVGSGYQGLKNKYKSLKTIEEEVNHRATEMARRSKKGLADMTDIFTGGDLIAGALTQNPALVLRGVAGKVIKKGFQKANDQNLYIKRMFDAAYKKSTPYSWTSATPEKPIMMRIPQEKIDVPTYERKGINPELDYKLKQQQKNIIPAKIREMRPKVTGDMEMIEAMKRYQRGIKPYQ